MDILKIIRDQLVDIVNKIDAGNSNLDEDLAFEVIDLLSRYSDKEEKLSRVLAANYMRLSLRTFDRYVYEGKIKQGEKQLGFKEKFFLKKDLDETIRRMKDGID